MIVRFSTPVFDPVAEMNRELSDLLWYSPFRGNVRSEFPAVDVAEYEDRFELVAELAGMKKEDLRISLEKGVLTLSGERKHYGLPEGTRVVRHESFTQPFSRSFELPEDVDENNITAELTDGILRVRIPKTEQARPRQIAIR